MTTENGNGPRRPRRPRKTSTPASLARTHRRKLARVLRRLETRHVLTFTLSVQAPRVPFGRTIATVVTLLLATAVVVPWAVGTYTLVRAVLPHH